jgi:hypothetical protein
MLCLLCKLEKEVDFKSKYIPVIGGLGIKPRACYYLILICVYVLFVVFLSFWKQEFQKTLGGKQPVYDTTIRTGRALKEKTLLAGDTQKLDNLLGEVRDKWDTVCGKSVER